MAPSESRQHWTFVVPGDPDQRTGGYGYVRAMVAALNELGQDAGIIGVAGRFPRADAMARQSMDHLLGSLADNAVVVIDGLALGGLPDIAARHRDRLRLIALVHHPLADETGLDDDERESLRQSETRALAQVRGVVTTSGLTAAALEPYQVPRHRIRVAQPGVRRQTPVTRPGDSSGSVNLLCVAQLSPRKAQHQLVAALAALAALDWHCVLAGSSERAPAYARDLLAQIEQLGLRQRFTLPGELEEVDLERAYRDADLFVLPSLHEGYGMVIDEAISHGLPVIASDGGALAETANRPGAVSYPAGDIDALAARLRRWIEDPRTRNQAATEARHSAASLPDWTDAARVLRESVQNLLRAEASHFDGHWLELRETADHQARSPRLTALASQWLEACRQSPDTAAVIADLGCGSGSNAGYLMRQLTLPAHWHLFDQDPALLASATDRVAGAGQQVTPLQAHLSRDSLGRQLPRPLQLVTASALIDLVSADWLQALAAATADRQAAILVVLSYAGHFSLAPGHGDDAALEALVNRHQHGDKGLGAAQGPAATDTLAGYLRGLGYRVELADSVWQLDHSHRQLQQALLRGWHEAALAQAQTEGQDRPWLDAWLARRLQEADRGTLAIRVRHLDLFGSPAL